MEPIRKEYNNLIYNDDFTCCLGIARATDKIILHENTKEVFGQEGNHFHEYVTEIIVNDKLERINSGAFDKCNIKKIDLSHTKVRIIGWHAFEYCSALKEVILPETLTYLGKYCFLYCKELEKINLEDAGLIQIDDNCFEDCLKLKNIKLPSTLMCIEKASFIKYDIEKLDLSNTKVTRLNPDTFTKCTALKEIILPKNLEIIYSHVFTGCDNLEAIRLPDDVKINLGAFTLCKNLKEINVTKTFVKTHKEFIEKFKDKIKTAKTLDQLLNEGVSFKKINKIIKNNEPTI